MTVNELQLLLDDFHGDLKVIIRSDTGDTIEDHEDFTVDTRDSLDETVLALIF